MKGKRIFLAVSLCMVAVLSVLLVFFPDVALKAADGIRSLLAPPDRSSFTIFSGWYKDKWSPKAESESDLSASELPEKIIIVLDPGHGGSDPGAVSLDKKHSEREVNLKLALALKESLEKYSRFEVYLTRGELPEDVKMSLEERCDFAQEKGAHIMLSLHNNANFADCSGAECYVTASQNSSLADASRGLASELLSAFSDCGMNRRGVFVRRSQDGSLGSDGEPSDYYGVIRMCTERGILSLLVEHGFMNETDLPFVTEPERLRVLAQREACAIARFFGLEEHSSPYYLSGSDSPLFGDADASGSIDGNDVSAMTRYILCEGSECRGEAAALSDFLGDGIDAGDLLACSLLAEGRNADFEGSFLPEVTISSQDKLKTGGKLTLDVSFSSCSSAAGTIDYNRSALSFVSLGTLPEGLTVSVDRRFGVLRYCYLSPSDPSPVSFRCSFKVLAKKKKTLSINHNLYSSARLANSEKITLGGQALATFTATVLKR